MKLLIVDDEANVRELTRLAVRAQQLGITEILEASGGEEALTILRALRPEIAILDMNMPGVDGPALLRCIDREQLPTRVIVVSGYDSFEYTKQAIRYGTADYLLKPVNAQELNQTLASVLRELSAGRTSGLLASLADGGASDPHICGSLSQFLARIPGKSATILRLRIHDAEQTAARFYGIGDVMLLEAIRVLGALPGETLAVRSMAAWNELYLFAAEDINEPPCSAAERYWATSRVLLETVGIRGLWSAVCGVTAHISPSETLRATGRALLHGNLLSGGVLYPQQPASPPLRTELAASGLRQSLVRAARSGDKQAADTAVRQAFGTIREEGTVSVVYLHDLVTDLLNGLVRGSGFPEQIGPHLEAIFTALDFDAVTGRLRDAVSALIGSDGSTKEAAHSETARALAAYLETHFAEDITLDLLAQQFHLSREYISRLFKREFGVNLFHYLRDLRLDRSSLLLQNTARSISDIAGSCGFSDSSYFIKSFRERYGITPTELRGRRRKP